MLNRIIKWCWGDGINFYTFTNTVAVVVINGNCLVNFQFWHPELEISFYVYIENLECQKVFIAQKASNLFNVFMDNDGMSNLVNIFPSETLIIRMDGGTSKSGMDELHLLHMPW